MAGPVRIYHLRTKGGTGRGAWGKNWAKPGLSTTQALRLEWTQERNFEGKRLIL